MDLASLPPEVFRWIIEDHLTPEDVNQLSRTNRRLNTYLRKHADFIWSIFLKRDYPAYAAELHLTGPGTLKAHYLNLRKALSFSRELIKTTGIPPDNAYVPILTKKIVQQYTNNRFLPLNALFDDHTPALSRAKHQCSIHIDAFLNRITLTFRVLLDDTQRHAVRLVMTPFLRAHIPIQTLAPVLRNRSYVVTGVTMRLLPQDLRVTI